MTRTGLVWFNKDFLMNCITTTSSARRSFDKDLGTISPVPFGFLERFWVRLAASLVDL